MSSFCGKLPDMIGRPLLFLLALPLAATPTYTNTGSASTTCFAGPSGATTLQATGPSIDLECPVAGDGPDVIGYADNLYTQASTGQGSTSPSFSFTSSMSDSITPIGGSGDGVVELTLIYDWQNIGDTGLATTAGDFYFNGSQSWAQSDITCLAGQPWCWQQDAFNHVSTVVLDEAIIYGVPFSIQADVSSSSLNTFWQGMGNSLTISESLLTGGKLSEVQETLPITAPEPAYSWITGIAMLFLGWLKRPNPSAVCPKCAHELHEDPRKEDTEIATHLRIQRGSATRCL
jgi:hypothetical protein